MKKLAFLFMNLLIMICLLPVGVWAQSAKPLNRSREGIIRYLNQVIRDSSLIVGQYCGVGSNTAKGYDEFVEGLHRSTNKYPALLSVEYGYTPDNDLKTINGFAIKHWKRGGLVTISWHADNPWVEGYDCRWNTIDNKAKIDFKQLLKNAPASGVKSDYRQELMKVGQALKELQDSGVTVLWRPFHEMNGFWFWWGANDLTSPTNKEEFRQLWKDMYDTFTVDLGLHNLIWVYGANAYSKWVAPIDWLYPGSKYVDVVGTDIYSKAPEFADYATLKTFNKPIVIAEIGPSEESYGKYDELEIIKTFRGKAAWFLQWSSWTDAKVAIIDNLHFSEMMHHPAVITLDKL
jgi:mannan endo-1,4-beta-mannosidase